MTVGALSNSRVFLMSYYLDFFKRAVILVRAVMLALVDSAFDTHICFVFHSSILPYIPIETERLGNSIYGKKDIMYA